MFSSVNTLSLHYPKHLLHTHTFPKFHFNPILKFSQKPSSVITFYNKPISHNHPFLIKKIPQKIVLLLVGSFIFMGFCTKKPVLAQSQRVETQSQRVDLDEEEIMYAKLLESDSKNVEGLKAMFHGKMKRGKTKEAIEYIDKLIAIEPKEVEWRLLQALCYEIIGEYSMAKTLFKNVLKERPLLLRALHGLAMVMHKNLEGPAVFEMLNNALEIARQRKKVTDERNIRILIAQMHVVKGELDDAMKQFKDLIEENPRDFRPYLCQGIIYSLLDKNEEAEEQFLTYQSLLPDEFPQREFLDDVVLAAKTEIRQKGKNMVKPEFSMKK